MNSLNLFRGSARSLFVFCLLTGALFARPGAAGENASSPSGEVFKELPTLHCLGMRWAIKGDANQNATIEVRYRQTGTDEWKNGFPLFRTRPNTHASNMSKIHTVAGGWMFAGSIVGLEQDTEYEVKLNLKDPDGGEAEQTVKMKTWAEPKEPPDMTVKHVVPGNGGGSGTEADPYKGLQAADAAAQPGTLFLLRTGTYVKDQCPENTWTITQSGAPGKPIIYRAAGDGDVLLDGGGDSKTPGRAVSANKIKQVWFEGVIFQGREYAIVAHEGSNWVIRRCRFRNMTKGFTAHNGGYDVSQYFFIVDNVFEGPTTWPRSKGIEPYGATKISGAGHIIAYNYFHNLGDATHGTAHGSLSASDLHNNDIFVCTDDGLETDHSDFNVRVFNNRIINVAHAITSQPAHGGPTYVFRNFIYNATYSPFKLHNHTSGVLFFHNTCLRKGECFKIIPGRDTVNYLFSRNNLFLGSGGTALFTSGVMRGCDLDADGYGGWSGAFAVWNGKRWVDEAAAKAAGEIYKDVGAFKIDPQTCFADGLLPPANPDQAYKGNELNFRLSEKSDALDKGVVLFNFSDGFKGAAPDLGALELGDDPPHFGPRPKPE
jgi:hypothetical protein